MQDETWVKKEQKRIDRELQQRVKAGETSDDKDLYALQVLLGFIARLSV